MFIHLTHWIINTDEISLVEVTSRMDEAHPEKDETVLLISIKGRRDGIEVTGKEADYLLHALTAMDNCADICRALKMDAGW